MPASMFATFDAQSYFGSCPNIAVSPPNSFSNSSFMHRNNCTCTDGSFGGVIDLAPVDDLDETYPKGSVMARLDAFLSGSGSSRVGAHATETAPGAGFAWSSGVSFISDGVLSLACQGETGGLLGVDEDGLTGAERSAWSILGYYHDHASLDIDVLKSDMVAGLASLSGSWAFILQDRKRHRVVAARSLDGAVPLMWGETSKNCLLFSTTQDSAVSSEIDASPFPPGCVFVSSVADKLYDVTVKRACPGRLVSFAQPPSSGVRRVRSRGSLSRITSGVDLDLIKTFAAGKLRTTPSFSNLFGSANELNAMAEV